MKIDISTDDLVILKAILQKYFPNYSVWCFGSRVNGNAKPNSDIDVVIISSSVIDFSILGQAKEELSESNISIKVDLLDWSLVSDEFKKIIKSNYFELF